MTRRRWIYPGNGEEPFEVGADYAPDPKGPMVFGDTPGYQSPVTGLWVEGRVARREDLKRTGSRPWEGVEAERKESARQKAYSDAKLDESLTKTASEAFYQLPPAKQAVLRRGG